MEYSTDFTGHIDIHPRLNDDAVDSLAALSQSRRCRRQRGLYVLPGSPLAEASEEFDGDGSNTPAGGQPGLWFRRFTSDDHLDRMIVGRRRDNTPLFTVASDPVAEKSLSPADPQHVDGRRLADEDPIDRRNAYQPKKRCSRDAVVIPLLRLV